MEKNANYKAVNPSPNEEKSQMLASSPPKKKKPNVLFIEYDPDARPPNIEICEIHEVID